MSLRRSPFRGPVCSPALEQEAWSVIRLMLSFFSPSSFAPACATLQLSSRAHWVFLLPFPFVPNQTVHQGSFQISPFHGAFWILPGPVSLEVLHQLFSTLCFLREYCYACLVSAPDPESSPGNRSVWAWGMFPGPPAYCWWTWLAMKGVYCFQAHARQLTSIILPRTA